MSTISMITTASAPDEEGVKDRLIQRLESAIQAEQTINIGDTDAIDLLAQYQLGIRNYNNVVVYHTDETPRNNCRYMSWDTVRVDGTIEDRKNAMTENADYVCVVCDSASDVDLSIDRYKGVVHYVTKGVNISSSERGIGGALCIDDRKCRESRLISREYPVFYQGLIYNCAIDLFRDEQKKREYFELHNNAGSLYKLDDRDWLGVCLTEKFKSNPRLWLSVRV